MNNLDAIYDFILKELRKLTIKENFYFKPIKPKLSDLELIAINISAEYLSIDSEYQLFRYLSNSKLKGMIERSVFNRRKRKLFLHLENIRKLMVAKFNEMETTFIVDSMPLEMSLSFEGVIDLTNVSKSVSYKMVPCKQDPF